MTIRLTASTDGTATTVVIEGRLTVVDLPDVSAACESADAPLRLDLSNLKSADDAGIRAIRSLAERGAKLHGATPFISHLMRAVDE
jgi:anti-anti-sigma regulatory factor